MKSAPARNGCKLKFFAVSAFFLISRASCQHDYVDALNKALMFLEAQRQGVLPSNQRITWRGDSALSDGRSVGRDLSGGYADSGDNVKFGLPMAFTISTLAWGVVEFSSQFNAAGQLGYALQAIKWGTDFFINAHPSPLTFYAQVGEGQADHSCWERPEDMNTPRKVYVIDQNHPGSEVAAETAAAMAAAAVAFAPSNPGYAATLVTHAKQLFTLADTYRGRYTDSIPNAQAYYASYSGYEDELLWAAAWLYRATRESQYLQYCVNNGASMGGSVNSLIQFDWDNKYVGVQMLMAKVLFSGEANAYSATLSQYQKMAEIYVCAAMQLNSQYSNMQMPRTPGGMVYIQPWSSLQYVTTTALLVSIYSDYLWQSGRSLKCANTVVSSDQLNHFVVSQANYILGTNPKGMSYMVGFSNYYPSHAHHRGSSVVSKKVQPNFPGCNQGYSLYFNVQTPNVNLLTGAIIGGPDEKDQYTDSRQNYQQNEPSTYINAPFVGALARIVGGYVGGANTVRVPVTVAPPTPRPTVPSPNPKHHKKRCDVKCRIKRRGNSKGGKNPPPTTFPYKFQRALWLTNRAVSSWTSNGIAYSQYSVSITNRSIKPHGNIVLSMGNAHNPQIWSVIVGNQNTRITIPTSITLQKTQSFTFGYIQAGGPLTIKVVSRT